MKEIYLDAHASTAVDEEVIDAMMHLRCSKIWVLSVTIEKDICHKKLIYGTKRIIHGFNLPSILHV